MFSSAIRERVRAAYCGLPNRDAMNLAEMARAVARKAEVSYDIARAIVAALEDCEDGLDVD